MPGIEESKCVLVTGATAGIGRALAYAIKNLRSKPKVIAAGRREDRLEQLARDGFEVVKFDVGSDKATLKKAVDEILAKYPDLDTIILNAGVQREIDLLKPFDLDTVEWEMNINYFSVVSMINFFLPHMLKLGAQGRQTFIVTVTSGLALIPSATVPNYSASKAAVNSLTLSLQVRLEGTNVNVLEIIPPLVESELHDAEGTTEQLSKFWMPLDDFIAEVMQGLVAGKAHIGAGNAATSWEHFGKGKDEIARQIFSRAPRNF